MENRESFSFFQWKQGLKRSPKKYSNEKQKGFFSENKKYIILTVRLKFKFSLSKVNIYFLCLLMTTKDSRKSVSLGDKIYKHYFELFLGANMGYFRTYLTETISTETPNSRIL